MQYLRWRFADVILWNTISFVSYHQAVSTFVQLPYLSINRGILSECYYFILLLHYVHFIGKYGAFYSTTFVKQRFVLQIRT